MDFKTDLRIHTGEFLKNIQKQGKNFHFNQIYFPNQGKQDISPGIQCMFKKGKEWKNV